MERAAVKEIWTEKQKEFCKSIYWTAGSLLLAGNPQTEVRSLMAPRHRRLHAAQMALFRPENKNVSQDMRISFITYFSCVIYNHVYSVHTENNIIFNKILVCNMCGFCVFYIRSLYSMYMCYVFFIWSQLSAQYFLVYLFQLLYMFRVTMCPSSGELTVSVRHWYFSLCMGGCLVCCSRQPPIQSEKYQCRISTVSSPDDGHIVARNM